MNKKIIIEYETGNDAFQGDFEIMEGIQKALKRFFEDGGPRFIMDLNGNCVGRIYDESDKDGL